MLYFTPERNAQIGFHLDIIFDTHLRIRKITRMVNASVERNRERDCRKPRTRTRT